MGSTPRRWPDVESDWGARTSQTIASVRADVLLALIESALIVVAYSAALSLRFLDSSGGVPTVWWARLVIALPILILVHIGSNAIFGNYGHVWKYASIDEAIRLLAAAMTSGFVLLSALLAWRHLAFDNDSIVPVSVLVVGVLLTLGGMGALRFWSRMFAYRRYREIGGSRERALIVGIGTDAVRLARHRSSAIGAIFVVGFVDPEAERPDTGRRLAGLPVLGHASDVARLVAELAIDQVIIATRGADTLGRQLVDLCMQCEVRLRILPDIDSVLQDSTGTSDIRDLELADLLPRQTVETDLSAVTQLIAGRSVLVTGAGGSIGSELVRQLLRFGPERLIALDHDETHLHDASAGWSSEGYERSLTVLADIRDDQRIRSVFDRYRPEVVFHAAAHKHVPILEHCPSEAMKTNVLGTANVIGAARDYEASHLVLISTDKAVDPSSVMGASKRFAEMLVQASAGRPGGPKMSAVRFGNVLGSRGSVVPTFAHQIASGGPVTVSHPDMERYFMTVDEAVQLVLQAATLSEGGEVFVLDMGQPVRIVDLANRMIRLAGLVPGKDIEVEYNGRRPGEKLTEHLSVDPLETTLHGKILTTHPSLPGPGTMVDALEEANRLVVEGGEGEVAEFLFSLGGATWAGDEVIDLRPDPLVREAQIRRL